jgi:hypothetical protein
MSTIRIKRKKTMKPLESKEVIRDIDVAEVLQLGLKEYEPRREDD